MLNFGTINQKKNFKAAHEVYKTLDIIWDSLPNIIGSLIATFIIFIIGSAMRGDWLLILIYFMKHMKHESKENESIEELKSEDKYSYFEYMNLKGLHRYILINLLFSYGIYFGIGGFLHWWFYVRQKDDSEKWKCQPNKWLPPELEQHEIKLGSKNVGIGALIFGSLACYIDNGGFCTLYYVVDEYGWLYLILSIPCLFLYQDGAAYYIHRLFHTRHLYKTYHKVHHLYKQPTPFSVSAFHTTEFLILQWLMIIPMFLVPIYSMIYIINLMYIYYYGIMTHSGINFKSVWPWQPDVMFHDDHHQYFNVNFGFNLTLWDKLHGTYRHESSPQNTSFEFESKVHSEEMKKIYS